MSSKTKIFVFHMKELIYTGIFIVLGILLIVLLTIMFSPSKIEKFNDEAAIEHKYIPGVYSTGLVLGEKTVNIEVIVDETEIQSIQLKNLDEAITTMYPLIQPSFQEIKNQLKESKSIEEITYSDDKKYTSMILLNAIETSLKKAEIPQQ